MLRRPPRIRLTRVTLLTALLSLAGLYYFLFSSPADLPEELLQSSIYHPKPTGDEGAVGKARKAGGRWARKVVGGFGGKDEVIGLAYGDDGLVRGWDTAHDLLKRSAGIIPKRERKRVKEVRDRHPIEELMERGKERWEGLLAR